jgi:hypothetical protein
MQYNLCALSIALFLSKTQSCLYFKTTFRKPDYVSILRWNPLGRAQLIELVNISGHQAQHEPSAARIKTGVN